MVVESTFAEAVLLETVLLSIYNHDSAIASAASRMTWAAGDRPCIEMGSRRTHEAAAVASARAAYVAGFTATSNLRARQQYGVPTHRHERALLHPAARHRGRRLPRPGRTRWAAARRCWSTPTTSPRPCGSAVEVAGAELGAVRIDSGDLGVLAHRVRAQLDDLGAHDTRIIVTSDLDEFAIAGLASAPVDGYGVGTELVVGSGHPTCGFVYKLVAREDDARHAGRRRQEEHRQDLDRRPQVRPAPPLRPTASPRPRWSASASRPRTTATTGSLLVPLVQRRRGRRARVARGRPGAAPALARRAAAGRPPALQGRARDRDDPRAPRATACSTRRR